MNSKKILIDVTFLFDQYTFRGIGRLGKEVVKRLVEKDLEDESFSIELLGFNTLTQALQQFGFSQYFIDENSPYIKYHSIGEAFPSSPQNTKKWKELYLPIIEEVKPDVFYSVNFERGLPSVPEFNELLKHKPKTIIHAHDAIPLVNNSFSNKGFIVNLLKGRFYKYMFEGIKNADEVITISKFSEKDFVKFGVPKNKISVIYLGIDDAFRSPETSIETQEGQENPEVIATLRSFDLTEKEYFIYDSGLEENKGINELLEIFAKIVNEDNELPKKLVLVGKDFQKSIDGQFLPKNEVAEKTLKIIKKLGLENNVITTDRVSDEELIILLKNSFAYFNFSKYEGFSFGPVQAMAAGVPAVVGDYSCIPEVTAGGAFLVKTEDIQKAYDSIKKYLEDDSKVLEMVKKGKKVSEKYTWDDTADKILKILLK